MCRFVLVLCLTVAHATAWAQSAQSTSQAQAVATDAERTVTQLAARSEAIEARYHEQTDTVSQLKSQPRSWNHDRDLKAAMRDADVTRRQADTAARDLSAAKDKLATARRAWLAAVDAELPTVTGERASELKAMRARLASQLRTPPRKIILPNAKIDPNADPEDLDQQAAAIRETETQLSAEVAGLEALAAEHAKNAELLKHHQRANDMDIRDDNQAHRIASHSTSTGFGGAADSAQTPAPPADSLRNPPTTFEADAPIVLQGVIDSSTLQGMERAQHSGDPAQRAQAARTTRDAVNAQLVQLHQKRMAIEKRARELRPKK